MRVPACPLLLVDAERLCKVSRQPGISRRKNSKHGRRVGITFTSTCTQNNLSPPRSETVKETNKKKLNLLCVFPPHYDIMGVPPAGICIINSVQVWNTKKALLLQQQDSSLCCQNVCRLCCITVGCESRIGFSEVKNGRKFCIRQFSCCN